MDFIGLVGKYRLSEELEKEIQSIPFRQDIKGKIIEKELESFVKNKVITGLNLESSVGLHTLRINLGEITGIGENDLVIHMAKESLRAFELLPISFKSNNYSRKGIIVAFRKNIKPEYFDKENYDEPLELDINRLEKGISGDVIESIGKIVDDTKYSSISCVFPTWHYEDWVQIHFANTKGLIIRMDPQTLYGVGIGKINKSSLKYSQKEDSIFYWRDWSNKNIEESYYKEEGGGSTSYEFFSSAKVKIKSKRNEL